ncbi:hypothetical protein B0H13DRAFT_1915579 [Mycena leptocephala]|nr:hypothetical protein B0H13DRAFT_1915579 [Mycena leptocephala]
MLMMWHCNTRVFRVGVAERHGAMLEGGMLLTPAMKVSRQGDRRMKDRKESASVALSGAHSKVNCERHGNINRGGSLKQVELYYPKDGEGCYEGDKSSWNSVMVEAVDPSRRHAKLLPVTAEQAGNELGCTTKNIDAIIFPPKECGGGYGGEINFGQHRSIKEIVGQWGGKFCGRMQTESFKAREGVARAVEGLLEAYRAHGALKSKSIFSHWDERAITVSSTEDRK